MRLAIRNSLFIVLAAMFSTACESRTITSERAAGRITLAFPKALAGRDATLAAQQQQQQTTNNNDSSNGNGDNVTKIRVRVSVTGESRTLLDTNLDPNVVCPNNQDNTSDTVCTATVEFHYPPGSERATFEVVVDAFDAADVQNYRIGPATFQLSADGTSGSVTAQAVYVGPGSDATGVVMNPRAIFPRVGNPDSASCSPTHGGAPTNTFAPLRVYSGNTAVASVNFANTNGVNSDTRLQVFGAGPGTTKIFCELDFGSHARDSIDVTVTSGPLGGPSIQLVSGANQAAAASTQLPNAIVVRVVGGSGQPLSGITLSSTVGNLSGFLSPAGGTTDSLGTFTTRWMLGPLVGIQTITIGFPNGAGGIVSPLMTVTATGR